MCVSLRKYYVRISTSWYSNDVYCSFTISERDASHFLKRKEETKASAPELDAEIDKQILTVGEYVCF